MNFNVPIGLRQRSQYSEGSKLASSRDSRSNSQLWKKNKNSDSQLHSVVQALQKTVAQVSKQRRKPLGGGFPAQALQDFQIVSDGGDYYNCNPYDGVTAGGGIVKVAKHQDIRCILPSATPAGGAWPSKVIRGVTYTYTYDPVVGATTDGVNVIEYSRSVAGSDASAETDYITPCLNIGDIITAFQTSFAGPADLVDVTWQALADGRAWARL